MKNGGRISGHMIKLVHDKNNEYIRIRIIPREAALAIVMEAEEEAAPNTYIIRPNFKHK